MRSWLWPRLLSGDGEVEVIIVFALGLQIKHEFRSLLERPDTLSRIGAHTLVHPIRHGARVTLPRSDVDQMLSILWHPQAIQTLPFGK